MRTISWKHPFIGLFIAGSIFAACSDDTTSTPPDEGGAACGNGTIDTGEKCDTKKLRTCMDATMGSKPSGVTKCSADCKMEDATGCKAAGGAGGGGGQGGGTGGIVGMGGGPSTGGKGGTVSKDAGGDADSGSTTTTPDAAKP